WLNNDSQDTVPDILCHLSKPNSTVNKPREVIMREIEGSLLDIIKSLLYGNPVKVPISTRKSRSRYKKNSKKSNEVASQQMRVVNLRRKKSTRVLALAYKIVVTKRDMFYRDVNLFVTQSTVDISAASKGLVFGPILIQFKNNKIIDCMTPMPELDSLDEQGFLIPPVNQISEIYCKAKCMIIIEKEATFRHLVSIGFCQTLPE
ncbi:endodeoxyribonuclease, partial [Rhizopus stolonifer]